MLLVALLTVTTAANTVPITRLGAPTYKTVLADLRPAARAGLTLTTMVTGTGNIIGTNGADLILGAPGTKGIMARQGNDCIVGGADVEAINGGGGTDVCIGRTSTDYRNCATIIEW